MCSCTTAEGSASTRSNWCSNIAVETTWKSLHTTSVKFHLISSIKLKVDGIKKVRFLITILSGERFERRTKNCHFSYYRRKMVSFLFDNFLICNASSSDIKHQESRACFSAEAREISDIYFICFFARSSRCSFCVLPSLLLPHLQWKSVNVKTKR